VKCVFYGLFLSITCMHFNILFYIKSCIFTYVLYGVIIIDYVNKIRYFNELYSCMNHISQLLKLYELRIL